jgi:hypothetical protein
MKRKVRGWPLLVALLSGGPALAQSLPPQPVPASPPTVMPGPEAPLTPAPPPIYPGALPSHDDLLEAPTEAAGWLGAVEFGIVKPHVNNSLAGNVSWGVLGTDTVQLPGASLEAAVELRFDLGYRFADGLGGVLFSYKTLSTDGRATLLDFDPLSGDSLLRSRLDLDIFDFDYVTPKWTLGHHLDLQTRLGVRVANVFLDSAAFGQVLEQHVTNHFIGAGPHAGLDAWYRCDVPGLGIFARLDGALPIGSVHQTFEESFADVTGSVIGSASSQSATRVVPTVSAQIGVGWQPIGTHLRFSGGYEFEYWWDIGHVGLSHATLWDQGGFFRVEFRF